ncbi:MAG TPA: hypothetical protein PLJ42_12325 [Chitinophagales bacterium]|nr:hypothetical protein [Chitinophagales bacterium]HQW80210.1 hypothetical protein [Chitinophagales bacterium]HRB68179.1 hypothetical protein [Chitinophagales bacterium]
MYLTELNTSKKIAEVIQENKPDILERSEQLVETQTTPTIETQEKDLVETRTTNSSNKPKRELPKSSDLGTMFKEIHKEISIQKNEHKIELTSENVITLWQQFLSENKSDFQPAFLNIANTQTPTLVEDKLQFVLTNNISLEIIQLHKMDITSFFRKHTISTTIVPEFILKRDETIVKTFKSSKERIKDMIDSNPSVLNLIKKFDLQEY